MNTKKVIKFTVFIIIIVIFTAILLSRTKIKSALLPIFSKSKVIQSRNINIGEGTVSEKSKIKMSPFAQNLGSPRFMAWTSDNTLLVSITKQGRVVALPDKDNDGQADAVIDVITNLRLPHGLAFHNNNLYIAEENRLIVLTDFKPDFTYTSLDVLIPNLPTGGNHFTRTVVIGPDNKIYISIGSTCNVCNEKHEWRASIIQANLDGSQVKIFAKGLRNSVGIIFRPGTQELWATDNGRDRIGDDLPPEEINIVQENNDYGWPLCYGDKLHDTYFDKNIYVRNPCEDTVAPVVQMQAHVAPLGLRFYQGEMFSEFDGDLFVAYHGSWNRTVPVGYSVARFDIKNNQVLKEYNFLDEWLKPNGKAVGRPVDIIFGRAGEMYISDDKAGVIYIVTKE